MITIHLDTPIENGGAWITDLYIETPMRAHHVLTAIRANGEDQARMVECFTESVCGLPSGVVGQLTPTDYAKVQEAIMLLFRAIRCAGDDANR